MSSKDQGPSDIFNCIKCGDCCKGYGGTFVSGDEIRKIADYLKTDPERFVENYCQMSGGKPVLGQGKDGYCIFWEDICKIHPVKPRMCKRWPFIQSVLVDIQNLQIMSALCPGIRTDVPDRVVRECVKKILSKSE
jgi:Fe-S-cluster containining protein